MYFSSVNLGRWRSRTICTGSFGFQRYSRSSVVQPSEENFSHYLLLTYSRLINTHSWPPSANTVACLADRASGSLDTRA